jgi:hypothetical protein
MSNVLYDSGRNAFLTPNGTGGQIDWLGNTIKAAMIHMTGGTQPYVFSAAHVFWSQVTALSGAVILSTGSVASIALGTKTAVAGVAGCATVVFPSVPVQASVDAIIIYKDTGTPTTSLLIAFIDTASGLPTTPNTSDITLIIDTGANKLFKL